MRHAILLAVILTGCALPQKPERWVGTLTPTTEGRTCVPSRAVLQIVGDHVLFAPDNGTWVLDGVAAPDGTITADRSGQGVDRKPYETSLTATRADRAIKGAYTTPRCTFDVRLAPA